MYSSHHNFSLKHVLTLFNTFRQWYVKDVKSSSGTFLNHVRLSAPGVESFPYPVNDGDVVQLGMDFKGGEEVIFRCVKIRIECNRGWQKSLNTFNKAAHKRLLKKADIGGKTRDSDSGSTNSSECAICLNPVAPCQALFVAPCSHVWHYKCVRNLIHSHNWPNFICPNCRFVADLEADVEQPEEFEESAEEEEKTDGEKQEEIEDHSGDVQLSETLGPSTNARNPFIDDDNTELMHTMSLSDRSNNNRDDRNLPESQTSLSEDLDESESTTDRVDSNGYPFTPPIDFPIGEGWPPGRLTNRHIPRARSITPTSNNPFALAAAIEPRAGEPTHDGNGPMTPRNDAGPFVFNGNEGFGGLPGGPRNENGFRGWKP